jgi:hypothetical protein
MEGLRNAKAYFNVQTNEYNYSCYRGYVRINEFGDDPKKYSIEDFVQAVERHLNPIPMPIVKDDENCTPEERAAINEYYAYKRHNYHHLNFEYVCSRIKFSSLKIGDTFDGYEIVAIDVKKNTVVIKDYETLYYYYVKDPNSKPSLYNTTTLAHIL